MKTFKQYLKEVHGDADYILGAPDDPYEPYISPNAHSTYWADKVNQEKKIAIASFIQDIHDVNDQYIIDFVEENLRIPNKFKRKPFFIFRENSFYISDTHYLELGFLGTISATSNGKILAKEQYTWNFDQKIQPFPYNANIGPENENLLKEAKKYLSDQIIGFVNKIKNAPETVQWNVK